MSRALDLPGIGALRDDLEALGAKVRVGFPLWLRPFVLSGVLAITLGRRVYLSPALAARGEAAIARILRHELVHLRQVARLGLIRFLAQYVFEYAHHRRAGLSHHAAYRAVRFEAEAFAEEEKLADAAEAPYNQAIPQEPDVVSMVQFHSLEAPDLERFLERHKASFSLRSEIDLDHILREILRKANEFVPSEAGSILLDDPFRKMASRSENDLVFIATFGSGSENLVGQRLSAGAGIVGRVYQTGTPYLSRDVSDDEFFFPGIDQQIGYKTDSVVCVPIYIGKNVCGVLELINRTDGRVFTERDMTLLEIFAGYTSFTLQNALDAKRAQELAKRDDLTGLFNDRWLHVRLHEVVVDAKRSGRTAVLIFMDLDYFKTINDAHGHLAGSQVLREVGFILKRVVTHEGSITARYGGDEFVIVLPNTTIEEGVALAERLKEAIVDNTFLDRDYGYGMPALHLSGVLSASFGVADYIPEKDAGDATDARKNDLIKRADSAMYAAKSQGKGRIVVSRSAVAEPGAAVSEEA
ncbi:MAG TPA: sensor domain-containing diguanylate cyclase [Thermoanaerobaculia bacterium]|nr:sensor domain-containing diguanylate cyclase [Thermoanaerobaculia bacterium]